MRSLPTQVSAARRVIWDFDGVIADTEPCQARAYELVLSDLGVHCAANWFEPFVGTAEQAIWPLLVAEHGLSESIDDLVAARSDIYLKLAGALVPAWYLDPVLDLAADHRIVSAGNHGQILNLLMHWNLADRFASVSATGSPGAPAQMNKKSRLLDALGEFGSDVVLFEDSASYLELARRQGATTVGVQHTLSQRDERSDLIVDHAVRDTWLTPTGKTGHHNTEWSNR